jgi:hypothetical protein
MNHETASKAHMSEPQDDDIIAARAENFLRDLNQEIEQCAALLDHLGVTYDIDIGRARQDIPPPGLCTSAEAAPKRGMKNTAKDINKLIEQIRSGQHRNCRKAFVRNTTATRHYLGFTSAYSIPAWQVGSCSGSGSGGRRRSRSATSRCSIA